MATPVPRSCCPARLSVRPWPLVLALALALTVAGCAGRSAPTDEGSGEVVGDPGGPDASLASVASLDFVTVALGDAGAARDVLAREPAVDATDGIAYDRELLAVRLGELEALGGTAVEVGVGDDLFDLGGDDGEGSSDDERAPRCRTDPTLACQVDLFDRRDRRIGSVVVHWSGDGVVDVSILPRQADGDVIGVGEARCSVGSTLLHGGHTPDRFDIAICIDQRGSLEYVGRERGTTIGIRLSACQDRAGRWEADNGGFLYVVAEESAARSTIEVFNPAGMAIEEGPFTPVELPPPATPRFC